MKVLDPGHRFVLRHLDGNNESVLQFVKREGIKYPGNIGSCEGTTMQEVLRAVRSRAQYVYDQQPCHETAEVIRCVERSIFVLESRAARCHNRPMPLLEETLTGLMCDYCGHVGCEGSCR